MGRPPPFPSEPTRAQVGSFISIKAHLISAVLQAAQQRQQIGPGEEVPTAALPGVAQQHGHGPCSGDTGQWDGGSTPAAEG